jgi:hypothetical protein
MIGPLRFRAHLITATLEERERQEREGKRTDVAEARETIKA